MLLVNLTCYKIRLFTILCDVIKQIVSFIKQSQISFFLLKYNGAYNFLIPQQMMEFFSIYDTIQSKLDLQ